MCALDGKTPHEMFFNSRPNISSIHIFGSDVWVLDQDQKGKLDPCSNKYKFIGLTDNTCAIFYYKPENGVIAKSRNIIFPHPHNPHPDIQIPISSPSEGEPQPNNQQPDVENQENEADQMPGNSTEAGSTDTMDTNSSLNHKESMGIRTRSQLKRTQSPLVQIRMDHGPVRMENQTSFACAMAAIESDNLDIHEALQHYDTEDWRSAMDAKVAQLQKLNTFELKYRRGNC